MNQLGKYQLGKYHTFREQFSDFQKGEQRAKSMVVCSFKHLLPTLSSTQFCRWKYRIF